MLPRTVTHGSQETNALRVVHVSVYPQLWQLNGHWEWEGSAEAVYCSNVMAFPEQFEGTKGLLHPDDAGHVAAAVELHEGGRSFDLSFRIISTWGSVLTLRGRGLHVAPGHSDLAPPDPAVAWERETATRAALHAAGHDHQRLLAADLAERRSGTASWYVNAVTYETHFSDNMFRLHGLQPQSLNAHGRTFLSFVHPDDAPIVEEAFDTAWRRRLPLEIVFRIFTVSGTLRWLRCATAWDHNERGEDVFRGMVQDETDHQETAELLDELRASTRILQETQRLSERQNASATWQFNLLTRQWLFSENYYRLHGVRPQELPINADLALRFVHPDDRVRVEEAFERMEAEHECPELEFRILRPDGQVRHLQLRGRAMGYRSGELIILGSLRDTTLQRALERREVRLHEQLVQLGERMTIAEELGSLCSWTWDLRRNKWTWSGGCYSLLGFKPTNLELSVKLFTSFLHPDDRKGFHDTLHTLAQSGGAADLPLRLEVKGELRYVQARLRRVADEGRSLLVAVFRDDSLRRQLEEERARDSAQLEALLAALPDKVLLTDAGHRVLRGNRALRAWLFNDGGFEGRNLFELFPGLKEGGFPEALQRALEGEVATLSTRPQGDQRRSMLHTLVPVRASGGGTWGVLHLLQDRALPNDLQERLAIQEHLAALLAETSTSRIVVLDRHMNYLYWNKACETAYGLRREEVVGRNLLEVAPGFYDEPTYLEFRRVLKGETVQLPSGRQNGNGVAHLLPVTDSEGAVACVLWIAPADEHEASHDEA